MILSPWHFESCRLRLFCSANVAYSSCTTSPDPTRLGWGLVSSSQGDLIARVLFHSCTWNLVQVWGMLGKAGFKLDKCLNFFLSGRVVHSDLDGHIPPQKPPLNSFSSFIPAATVLWELGAVSFFFAPVAISCESCSEHNCRLECCSYRL